MLVKNISETEERGGGGGGRLQVEMASQQRWEKKACGLVKGFHLTEEPAQDVLIKLIPADSVTGAGEVLGGGGGGGGFSQPSG